MFAALAAWTRLYSDALGHIGVVDFANPKSRRRAIGVVAWVFPVAWAALFLSSKKPGVLVILGGLITVVILLIVVFAALFFRYKRLDPRLRPTTIYDVALWISATAIFSVAIIGAWKLFGNV